MENIFKELGTDARNLVADIIDSIPLDNIDSLLEILNSPLGQVVKSTVPFVSISTTIVKFFVKKFQKEPTLESSVALVSQAAYLESLRQFFKNNPEIQKQLNETRASKEVAKKIKNWQKNLKRDGKEISFDDKAARETWVCFHDSALAAIFNTILQSRLEESGLEAAAAKTATERISRSTYRYMKEAAAEVQDAAKRLGAIARQGSADLEAYLSIDKYLQDIIATKPDESVFDEKFTFRDIYVPLQVKPVNKENGEIDQQATPENIEHWAARLLENPTKSGRVLFIQGGPGRGKSVFCRMFADWVRRELHPIWTPILIRLRDLTNIAKDFDETLTAAVAWDFAKSDRGWLTDRNTRYLFLLDGFDELLLERGASRELQDFFDQVARFQQDSKTNSERGHRILITGRPLALYGIERLMPSNLERVEIMPMDEEIQSQWLGNWKKVADPDAAVGAAKIEAFRQFLRGESCPERVRELAQEPLLLYLLAAMHRDGTIEAEKFAGADAGGAKVLIYEAALDWVLNRQRGDAEDNLNPALTGLDPEDLRSVLAEAGLCVVQSRKERAPVRQIEDRLLARGDTEAKALIDKGRKGEKGDRKDPLKNALAAFYLKAAPGAENSVEFFHKSFGEFLGAASMAETLEAWTEKTGKRRKTYAISDAEFDWQVCDLFGYGHLTPEIVEYLLALLRKSEELDWEILFDRLEDFYLRWCDGEFIEALDAAAEMLPLKKARQLQKYDLQIGQRQVDIYTGLNVLILLLEIHRHAQSQAELKDKIAFYPCGKEEEDFDRGRLLRIIGYSDCLGAGRFSRAAGNFLRGANLSGAYLSNADLEFANLILGNLSGANLSFSYLHGADLRGSYLSGAQLRKTYFGFADLSEANLRYADITEADLSHADLSHADLTGAELNSALIHSANLIGAKLCGAILTFADLNNAYLTGVDFTDADLSEVDLRDADLRDADLSEASLIGANLSGANLSGANLSELQCDRTTKWSNVRGLDEAVGLSEALKQLPRFSAAVALNRGVTLVRQGDVDVALAAYREAEQLDPDLEIAAYFWSPLCWFGCLHDRAADVLEAGDKAVQLEPHDQDWRDARGLCRALTGDIAGAIEDFEAVLNWDLFHPARKEKRRRWLEALQAGRNPFTPEEMEALRQEEG